jgi:hypothetical protein
MNMKNEMKVGSMKIDPDEYGPLLEQVTVDIRWISPSMKDKWSGFIAENPELGIRVTVAASRKTRKKWHLKRKLGFMPSNGPVPERKVIRKLKDRVLEDMDFMVDRYIVQGYGKISKSLAVHVERWRKIVDPSKRPDKDHWKDVEPDVDDKDL